MAGRFFRRGVSKVKFITAAANLGAPTAAEIAAGVTLDTQIAEISGFEFRNSPIPTPDLASTFTTSIAGEDTAADPSITFYDLDNSTTIRAAVAKGVIGVVFLAPYGIATGLRSTLWFCQSTGVNDVWTTGNESAKFMAGFAPLAAPASYTIPA